MISVDANPHDLDNEMNLINNIFESKVDKKRIGTAIVSLSGVLKKTDRTYNRLISKKNRLLRRQKKVIFRKQVFWQDAKGTSCLRAALTFSLFPRVSWSTRLSVSVFFYDFYKIWAVQLQKPILLYLLWLKFFSGLDHPFFLMNQIDFHLCCKVVLKKFWGIKINFFSKNKSHVSFLCFIIWCCTIFI